MSSDTPTCLGHLGLICSSWCGPMAKRRRKARLMKWARQNCAELQKLATQDELVPLEHLRAAEQHLALVEKWLVSQRVHSIRKNVAPIWQADLIATSLGVSEGDQKDLWEEEFRRCFEPVAHEEIFVTALLCSVLSFSFRYSGKIYISSARLCFDSNLLGVGARFSVPWQSVKKVRLCCTMQSKKVTTFPVRIYTKGKITFDGAEVDTLDVRIFNYGDLKILHKACMYCLGSGLFGTWQDPDSEMVEVSDDEKENIPMEGDVPVPNVSPVATELEAALVLQQRYSIWELNRWSAITRKWEPPFTIYDGIRKQRWLGLKPNGSAVTYPYAPPGTRFEKFAESDVPPLEKIQFMGQTRSCGWRTDLKEGETDDEGWQYGISFDISNDWQPASGNISIVRRRCWVPTFEIAENDAPLPKKAPTTYIKQKGLEAAKTVVFEGEVGEISLEALGQELEADTPWEANADGGLMAMYFHRIGAFDMDVGAWAEGGAAKDVQGKARYVEYRKPLPKKPMCPAESRIHSTCHVVVLEDRVVLEQSVLTLDTPASCAYMWLCDTFTVEGGQMKLVRTCGLEWIASSWIKGILETEMPKGAGEETTSMIETITAWAKKVAA